MAYTFYCKNSLFSLLEVILTNLYPLITHFITFTITVCQNLFKGVLSTSHHEHPSLYVSDIVMVFYQPEKYICNYIILHLYYNLIFIKIHLYYADIK